jgi:predicted nucleotidyltransferase component of viral defense system
MLTQAQLEREAADTGFLTEPLEKAIRLFGLLEALRSHPFLKGRLVLKGGTALNLFVLDIPRLSVDIDLNYIGAADREAMLAEQPQLNQALEAVCGRLGIQIRHVPSEHAGGKWRLSYTTASGRSSSLELDVNYMFRTPLWPHQVVDSHPIGSFRATQVPVLDVHELAAGKLVALFARSAARDLFDARWLLQLPGLDRERLRLGFVVYGGVNRRDWRTVSIEEIRADQRLVDRQLVPMLRGEDAPGPRDLARWSESLGSECRELLSAVLPFESHELEFLTRLNERGEIAPELITDEAELQSVIRSHPGLLWKAINVREYRGRSR